MTDAISKSNADAMVLQAADNVDSMCGRQGKKATVLAVDSDKNNRKRLLEILDRIGFDGVVAGDGQEAADQLLKRSFDIVFTPSTMYVPDIRKLFAECARVLRPNGILTMGLMQPAKQCMFLAGLISDDVYDPSARHAIEYMHYMDDIFNGLLDAGLSLKKVVDEGRSRNGPTGPVGSLDPAYVDNCGYFIVVATKQQSSS